MKNLILSGIFFLSCIFLYAQNLNTTQNRKENSARYQVSIGVNTVNNLGLNSPFNSPEDWAFKKPLTVGIEVRDFNKKDVALTLDFGYNEYDDGTRYYSLDASFKYYLNDWIQSEKLEIAPMAGAGAFNFDRTNVSLNAGVSVAYWISDRFAVRIKSLAKFAFNRKDPKYNISNNHFQHFMELIFAL